MAAKFTVPKFFSTGTDRSGTDSDSESTSHGLGGGHVSRAMSILSTEDNASLDSPISPRLGQEGWSAGSRSQVDAEDTLSACNSALRMLVDHLHRMRSEEAAGTERSLPPRSASFEKLDECASSHSPMVNASPVDFSALFSGSLLTPSTPNSPAAMMSVLGSSPGGSRSGIEALMHRGRRATAMMGHPLRSHANDRQMVISGRGTSPSVGRKRNQSPFSGAFRGSGSGRNWVTPEASPRGYSHEGDDTVKSGAGRLSPLRAQSAAVPTRHSPLRAQSAVVSRTASDEPKSSTAASSSPKTGPQPHKVSPGSRVLGAPLSSPLLDPVKRSAQSTPDDSMNKFQLSPDTDSPTSCGVPGRGTHGAIFGPERGMLLESIKQHALEPGVHASAIRHHESDFRRRAEVSSRARALSKNRVARSRSADRGQVSPLNARQERFESLPENRRKSIEIRHRDRGDNARSENELAAGAGASAGVGAPNEVGSTARKAHLTSDQKTEMFALEMLQDVASSSESADTTRQLEYLLESLDPFLPSTRMMEVVEALRMVILRKLNCLRDMESVGTSVFSVFASMLILVEQACACFGVCMDMDMH
jgi:hypothetical protein